MATGLHKKDGQGSSAITGGTAGLGTRTGLYTPEQRVRRDNTIWTPIQGFLAAFQFIVFLISLALVLRFLLTGEGYLLASISVVFKTLVLLTIMITGSIWEKVVFDRYLFAPAFYWEDMVSMLVIALHLAYVAAFVFDLASSHIQMVIALLAYGAYAVNAAQFLLKLRRARLESEGSDRSDPALLAGAVKGGAHG